MRVILQTTQHHMRATSICQLSLRNLEHDSLSAIIWFEANYMKLNQEKCHFMIAGNTHEFLWAKIGEVSIWEINKIMVKNTVPF